MRKTIPQGFLSRQYGILIALSLDPLSSIVNVNYAVTLMIAGRYPESLAQFQKVLERDPAFRPGHFYLSQLYAMTGDFADAVSELQKVDLIPGSFSADAQGYSRLMLSRGSQTDWAYVAVGFALAGDRNKTFEYLEKSFSNESDELVLCVRFPVFDLIRSDPRYADLMRRLGLPE